MATQRAQGKLIMKVEGFEMGVSVSLGFTSFLLRFLGQYILKNIINNSQFS